MLRLITFSALIISILINSAPFMLAQGTYVSASPANWLYPNGNFSATRFVSSKSAAQSIDSFVVKWSNPSISGDVVPLIGNIINNGKLKSEFRWGPNEITAVMGNDLVIIDARGATLRKSTLPPFVKNVSVLFDTLSAQISNSVVAPVALGLETIEVENLNDSLAFAYLAAFNHKADTVSLLKRLAIDLRPFKPNLFASIKPVLGRKVGNNFLTYASINMTMPNEGDDSTNYSYFRGFTQFNSGNQVYTYPLPDVGDDKLSRVHVANDCNFAQPSFAYNSGSADIALPNFVSDTLNKIVTNPIIGNTDPRKSYILDMQLNGTAPLANFPALDLSALFDTTESKPQIKPYFIHINNQMSSDSVFLLIAEEYRGVGGSNGISKLHLFDVNGNQMTMPFDTLSPAFRGGKNHYWSVAIGNVDGNDTNRRLPYYPNNRGNEIIVTQSSRELAYPGSKLMILKYNISSRVPKSSPPDTYLFTFDTIVSKRINGWVAAVNDLDNKGNGKDEIIVVDGSKITVLGMRDYNSFEFQYGNPFDTLYRYEFENQTISSIAVADLEGDGLNDIIVTTFDSLFVIGSPLLNILDVFTPIAQSTPPVEFCAGDSIEIGWKNITRGQNLVRLLFREYSGSNPTDNLIELQTGIQNDADTVYFRFTPPMSVLGKSGRFIIAGIHSRISDSTAILEFKNPSIAIDPLSQSNFRAGEAIILSGIASCIDSISLEYSEDNINWIELASQEVVSSPGEQFSIASTVPCVNYFGCSGNDTDSLLYFRVSGKQDGVISNSQVMSIIVRPALFPAYYDTSLTACPSIKFYWYPMQFSLPCDTVSISFSIDGGITYSYVSSVSLTDGSYLWNVPTDLPKIVLMRFCCENSCVRSEIQLQDIKPYNLGIVAPNPFKPPYETMEFVYKVPEDTDVTIKILDANNRIVAEPVSNQRRFPGISYCDRWNGDTSKGGTAANGIYYLVMELSNGIREVYQVFVRK